MTLKQEALFDSSTSQNINFFSCLPCFSAECVIDENNEQICSVLMRSVFFCIMTDVYETFSELNLKDGGMDESHKE